MTPSLPLLADISNPTLTQALQHALDQKTKPLGSLGQLNPWRCNWAKFLAPNPPRWNNLNWWCLRVTTASQRAVCLPIQAT